MFSCWILTAVISLYPYWCNMKRESKDFFLEVGYHGVYETWQPVIYATSSISSLATCSHGKLKYGNYRISVFIFRLTS